jgi:hypothetical protein
VNLSTVLGTPVLRETFSGVVAGAVTGEHLARERVWRGPPPPVLWVTSPLAFSSRHWLQHSSKAAGSSLGSTFGKALRSNYPRTSPERSSARHSPLVASTGVRRLPFRERTSGGMRGGSSPKGTPPSLHWLMMLGITLQNPKSGRFLSCEPDHIPMARQPYPRTGEVREKNSTIGEPGDGELKNTP